MTPAEVVLRGVAGLPEILEGDDLAALVVDACRAAGQPLAAGDVVVVSSKVVSKALGLRAPSREDAVRASTARVVAERVAGDKVTRVVEAVAGPVMAAGGVDASNTGPGEDVLVLPADADFEAARLLARLVALAGLPAGSLAVVVTDTAGRPWRAGQTDFALGSAGLTALEDLRGTVDADGRDLAVTARALADEVAAAADLVKGKAAGVPVAVVRGLAGLVTAAPARDAGRLVRQGPGDWFRLGHVEAVRAALGVRPGSPESEAVGIPSLAEEPPAQRCARAVRLAAHDLPGVTATVAAPATDAPLTVWVRAESAWEAGRFAGRLEVALWAEDLDPTTVRTNLCE